MARRSFQRSNADPGSGEEKGHLASEIPEHAITRLYLLPAGSAAEFMAEIENTEEPTPALRELFRGVSG